MNHATAPWINRNRFGWGFYVGKYADQVSEAILDQFRRRREALRAILKAHISEGRFLFGSQGNADGGLVGGTRSIDEWIDNLSEASLSARMSLTRDEALGLSETELRDRIAGDFRELFPLVLIATHDDPVTAIESLAGSDEELELQPEYTLKECAADTGFDLETLSMWRDAIERKGQAVCSTATPPPMTSSPRCGVGRISSGPACGLAEAGSGIQIMDERAGSDITPEGIVNLASCWQSYRMPAFLRHRDPPPVAQKHLLFPGSQWCQPV